MPKDTYKWTNPDTGEDNTGTFEYPVISSFEEATAVYGSEQEACRHLQRMAKVDGRNKAAASAKAKAGFGRAPMSEEEKIQAKATRQANASILSVLKNKSREQLLADGVSEEALDQLGIN